MIKYNNNSINDWYFDTSDIVKVYRNNAVRYQKIYDSSPIPPFNGKWLATYEGGTTSSAECDSTSAITKKEITLTNLTDVVIGNCVTSIGGAAFGGCSSLTSITIPDGVTNIGNNAFNQCGGLISIDIPDSVTSIGQGAFRGCSSLTSVTIPDIVTSIGNYAFRNCDGLTSVTVEATTPPTLGINVFDGTNDCPIYVPAESVNAYKTAENWSTYADRIQAIQ